jgi:hypothetical protein
VGSGATGDDSEIVQRCGSTVPITGLLKNLLKYFERLAGKLDPEVMLRNDSA